MTYIYGYAGTTRAAIVAALEASERMHNGGAALCRLDGLYTQADRYEVHAGLCSTALALIDEDDAGTTNVIPLHTTTMKGAS